MYQLSISAACSYVRRVLDELTSVEEIGMLVSPDAVDIHKLVEGAIVEATVKVHNNAPSIMIDGKVAEPDTVDADGNIIQKDYGTAIDKNGVMTITMHTDVVRIASVKANDSDIVVCDIIPEDSAEGRKQLNKYTRGIPDDPRVVLQKKWAGSHTPILKYYTFSPLPKAEAEEEVPDTRSVEICYVPYPVIEETIVEISPKLEYAVLNEITAMVLDSLNEHEKASLYREKSINYMQGK